MRLVFVRQVVCAMAMMCAAISGGSHTPAHAQGQTPVQSPAPTSAPAPADQVKPQAPAPKTFLPRPQPQTSAGSPPATQGRPPVATGPLQSFYFWIAHQQRQMTDAMSRAVRDLKAGGGLWAALVLSSVSFLYGVLHAAGPGHGKAVISSYVLADRQTVRRGTILAFLSAFVQALSALVLVAIISLFLKATRVEMASAEQWLERVSWAFVTGVGLWLLWSQLKALGWVGKPAHAHAHHHHDHSHDHKHHDHNHHQHNHRHDHAHPPHHHDHGHAAHAHTAAHHHGHHDRHHQDAQHHQAHHEHTHGPADICETCGHAHMPSPEAVRDNWSVKRALALAFAVGIRPCTGAILVLIFAIGQGLFWAGVLATFAMAVGTAITVSLLAAFAVTSRNAAERLGGGQASAWGNRISSFAGLVGAVLVTLLGASFFWYSLGPQQPF